ncbi:hypothetical protein [Lacinutrix sp. Hel_I_90]|uniref:hypothetical protein n=1 Tax=Lacinutrix sp. Hel_I_90 TaxID=1249999 RepID=UPI0012E0B4AB|nr:hypothetical protein [Lacinutrix sp. Hel_I_90]
MSKTTWLSLVLFTLFGYLIAQEAIPFKTQNEFYIYGDAVVIGNNILSKDAKEPFNDTTLTNDDIDMVYVDVDNDTTTFSSSTAHLTLPKNQTNIKYAALYWSATYSYEKGSRKESNGQFLFQGKREHKRDKISKIKFKTPNGTYKDIDGTVIFDGAREVAFTLNSPYACMADVTKLLKNIGTINGEYTVANVAATQGFVSGGSAAGWLLYVVYEAPTKNPKYITTYNGFAHVSGEPVKLKFSNFKSLEKGDVKTALTFAALEGDSALKEDECLFVNPAAKRVLLLNTNERPRNNFFNSKITYENNVSLKRFPNSENTLGFDIISMDLPESSQPLVDNNTTEVEMSFNTKADRFYLFFTAFQTEISQTYYKEQKAVEIVSISEFEKTITIAEAAPKKSKKEALKNKDHSEGYQKFSPKKQNEDKRVFRPINSAESPQSKTNETKSDYIPKVVEKEKTLPIWLRKKQGADLARDTTIYQPEAAFKTPLVSSLVLNRENYKKLLTKDDYIYETQNFKRILNQEPTFIEGVARGYYIIASLVYDLDNAVKNQKELLEKGLNSKIFKDTSQEKYYIYLFNSENFYDVFMLRKAFIKSPFLKEVWILNLNMEK